MKEALIDLSVLIVFFNRPQTLKKVFERVQEARPARLFLYQDGPRENRPDDIENVRKCREIVAGVDWQCEVHTLYQEKNQGVDPSGYLADTWAFSLTDKCLVLEDDVVPCLSFFPFVKKMLDEYENDERIMLISGMNHQEQTPVDSDYFFSKMTITWGWATWRRVVEKWDGEYSFLKDENKVNRLKKYIKDNKLVKNTVKLMQKHAESGVAHFETVLIANQYFHDGLSIVPSKNMCVNIGVTDDASHFANDIRFVQRGLRKVFRMKTYELNCDEIRAPKEVEDYKKYKKTVYYVNGWNRPVLRALRFTEVCLKKIFHGRFKEVFNDIKIRLKK